MEKLNGQSRLALLILFSLGMIVTGFALSKWLAQMGHKEISFSVRTKLDQLPPELLAT